MKVPKNNNNREQSPLHVFENQEFLKSSDARTLRILGEYLQPSSAFQKEKITDTIVFFGSARTFPEANLRCKDDISVERTNNTSKLKDYCVFYTAARELAHGISLWAQEYRKKSERHFCIVTGGGAGIMEAANHGAKEAGGESIGLNINLPFEPNANPYISDNLNFKFHYFFMRKYWFLYYARALIVFPGGFGTLDELFETLTLQQTKNIKNKIPIFLYGNDFWHRLIDFSFLSESGLIDKEDLNLIRFVDTVPEALKAIKECLSIAPVQRNY